MEFEKNVEQYLVREVKRLGGICLKHGQDGWPDRVVILPQARVAWCELKRTGGKLAPLQAERLHELSIRGQVTAVLWSREDVDKLLSAMHGENGG